jgi:MFS family permease
MFVVGLSVFSLASAACALAPGTGTLIAARSVQGAGQRW